MDFEIGTKVSRKAGHETALAAKAEANVDALQKPGRHAKGVWFTGPDIQVRKHTTSRRELFDDCSLGARDETLASIATILWSYSRE